MPDRVRELQRALADLALAPDAAAFEADPAAFAGARGLPGPDQAAFRRCRPRLLSYREFVREDIWEPVELYLPITLALLERAGALEEARSGFLASRLLASPYYRDIAPTFLGWLAATGWGLERWPFLVQLAHAELVPELVEHAPDTPPRAGLHPEPAPGDRIVPAPPPPVLAYDWRVLEATPEAPGPPPGPCHLLAFRDAEGFVRWRELTPATAAVLVRAQQEPIGRAAAALGLGDPGAVLALLAALRAAGALEGFQAG